MQNFQLVLKYVNNRTVFFSLFGEIANRVLFDTKDIFAELKL